MDLFCGPNVGLETNTGNGRGRYNCLVDGEKPTNAARLNRPWPEEHVSAKSLQSIPGCMSAAVKAGGLGGGEGVGTGGKGK